MSQNKRDSTVKFEGVDPAEGEEQTVVLDHGLKPSLQGIHAHVDQIVSQFLELFDSIRLVAEDDQYESIGRQFLAATVRTKFVEQGRRIIMVLPAFPAKSPNSRRKVLGKLPGQPSSHTWLPIVLLKLILNLLAARKLCNQFWNRLWSNVGRNA